MPTRTRLRDPDRTRPRASGLLQPDPPRTRPRDAHHLPAGRLRIRRRDPDRLRDPAHPRHHDGSPSTRARLLTALTWTLLLLGLWLWGCEVSDVRYEVPASAGKGTAATAGLELPPPVPPLRGARPQRVDIPALGVQAPVVPRGLDRKGAPEPPPYDQPGVVGWYAAGVAPGAAGTALLVGHLDTETRPAVFHRLGALVPGERIRVTRADGTIAEFTVDGVRLLTRERFDAHQAYGPHHPGRPELRLITCAGTYDRTSRTYSANVVVSAYLTGRR
ncbi:class F sortase [Streptomyces sp. NPDC047072]|uniref:class F sortase n=1 Tax=Streptomyces sp. NPDC047072 TaxID=3154809 RepID=UPI0033CD3B77